MIAILRKMVLRSLAILIAVAIAAQAFGSVVDLQAELFPPTAVRPGTTPLWIIGVRHISGEETTDWHVTFPIPAETTYVSVTPLNPHVGTCVFAAASLECSGTTLGEGAEFYVNLTVSSSVTQTIHSMVSITTSDNDTDPSNDQAFGDSIPETESRFFAGIDLPPTVANKKVTLSFDAFNSGRDNASDVAMDVSLPPDALVLSEETTFDSCTPPPIRCTAKLVAVGGQPFVHVAVVFPTAGTYELSSDISWTNLNSSSPPLHTSASLTVDPQPPPPPPPPPPLVADLAISVDAKPDSVSADGLITYSVAVTNAGNAPAAGVTVRSPFAALTFVDSSAHCTATPSLSCAIGTLASGSWAVFTVTARPAEAGKLVTTFSASMSDAEDHTSNNTATATVNVTAAAARRRAARH